MKRRTETTHATPEFMRESGAEVLEEKRVYGARGTRHKRRQVRAHARPAPAPRAQ